jgi:hypothetical protein
MSRASLCRVHSAGLRGEFREQFVLQRRQFVAVAEEDGEAGLPRPRLRAAHQSGKEGIGDIRHDERDVARPPCAQGPGGLVRNVAQPRRHRPDHLDSRRIQHMLRPESTRNTVARDLRSLRLR